MINWDFISPALRIASGIVEIHKVEVMNNWVLLSKFKVTSEQGSYSYSSLDDKKGISSNILDAVRPYLDSIIRSYRDGLILSKDTYCWVNHYDLIKSLSSLKEIDTDYSI